MAASNIEQFDEYAGQIFAHLYQHFPVPTSIVPREFIECESIGLKDNEQEYFGDEARIFLATAKWLVMTGYIHCREEKLSYIRDAVLTAKGLEILKLTPSSVVGGPSFGERLTSAAKEEGREALRTVAAEVLGIGVKMLGPLIGLSS